MRFPGVATAIVLAFAANGFSTRIVNGTPAAPVARFTGPLTLNIQNVARIADPKLDGGGIPVEFTIGPNGVAAAVDITVEQGGSTVATVFTGVLNGAGAAYTKTWNGKTPNGKYADPGDYTIKIVANADHQEVATAPLSLVRLGITAMEALPVNNNEEFPMVYFMKGGLTYAFYATPAVHEYYNIKKAGETADLDLNNGNPRPMVTLHEDLMSPPLNAGNYETNTYNFPYCYVINKTPRLRVTFGAQGVSQAGAAIGAGFPVAGYEIRVTAADALGAWISNDTNISPGGTATLDGPALSSIAGRSDRKITWKYEYRTAGGGAWQPVPGQNTSRHRYYTINSKPAFAIGATGTQYAGPWVMVADLATEWSKDLNITILDDHSLVETIVKGFFGQVGDVRDALMDCHYDCPSMGGDGGATHYYDFGTNTISLSRMLNFHANGSYINCSDCASITSTICSMLGVRSVQMLRLGPMTLKAIWGVGTPAYTTDLWGGGNHTFSYHHIVTRNGGNAVSDSCMCVDEDGNPGATPGQPGWNVDRDWNGASGYMQLSAYNTVTKTIDPLPKLQ